MGEMLTTGQVAEFTGIPQQTLIAWDRERFLRASLRRRRAGKAKGGVRMYTILDLVAARLARNLIDKLRFDRETVATIVAMIQSGDGERCQRAVILSIQSK